MHRRFELLDAQTNAGTVGAGHMNLAIFEQVPARRLMNDQGMRLYNLNHARGGSSAFRILLNNCGNAYESTKSSETF
jgi:hypothetical protein